MSSPKKKKIASLIRRKSPSSATTFFGTRHSMLALSNTFWAKSIQFLKLSKNFSQRKIMTPPLLAAQISFYLSFLQSGAHKNG
jgi:hypothetical protein